MSIVYLNGRYVDQAQAVIPVEDRGFVFGDGIYEVVRAVEGRIVAAEGHHARLANGLDGLRIDRTGTDPQTLDAMFARLLAENGLTKGEATIYLQVTRGAVKRLHHFPAAGTPTTIVAWASPFDVPRAARANGVKAITYPDQRWARCDLKTVNLLGAVLARQAAVEAGAYEAILHRDGIVMEGAATNAFAVVRGVLRTAPLTNYILPGITRSVLLPLAAKLGIHGEEQAVTLRELPFVDELFVCGTTTDVQAVVTLDEKPVGNGKVGPVTARLRDAYEAFLYGR